MNIYPLICHDQGVQLPKALIEPLGLAPGAEVDLAISPESDSIVIRPLHRLRPVRGRYRIEDLVSQLPANYEFEETEWGEAMGNEAW